MRSTRNNTNILSPSEYEQPDISLLTIFISFLKLGITSFGGPAMVAYIRDMSVNKKKWIGAKSFSNGIALCQMIPGATAMQTAAYVGLKVRGVPGAIASFLGFGLPAFMIMLIFSILYLRTNNIKEVISAFNGLRVVIISIIAFATYSFGKTSLLNWMDITIAVMAAILYLLGINPFIVIILSSLFGILILKGSSLHINSTEFGYKISIKLVLLILILFILALILLYKIKSDLFNLSLIMMKVDIFAFGGGFNSLPLLYSEIVDVRHLMLNRTFMDGIAIGQITPGPIIITATFVGYFLYGLLGAAIATISIFLPSFMMVVIVTPYFEKLSNNKYFSKAIKGILSSFVGLLLFVSVQFGLNVSWNLISILIAVAAFIALLTKVKIHWIILVTILISIFIL